MKQSNFLNKLVGIVLIGTLTAVAGISCASDKINPYEFVGTVAQPNFLEKYNGKIFYDCKLEPKSDHLSTRTKMVLWASIVPNLVVWKITETWYSDASCSAVVGSNATYLELDYVGSVPHVPFHDSSKRPIEAAKFAVRFVGQDNTGVFPPYPFTHSTLFPSVLLAVEGDRIYWGSLYPRDANDFPTELDANGSAFLPLDPLDPIN